MFSINVHGLSKYYCPILVILLRQDNCEFVLSQKRYIISLSFQCVDRCGTNNGLMRINREKKRNKQDDIMIHTLMFQCMKSTPLF